MEGRGGSVAVQLQQLILRSESVESFLEAFAFYTSRLFGSEDEYSCGITLTRGDLTVTAGSSTEAAEIEELRQGFSDDPWRNSSQIHQTFVVDEARTDERLPGYREVLRDRGFHAVVGVPAVIGSEGGAVISLYARRPTVFTPDVIERFEEYVTGATTSLELALKLASYRDAAADLLAAMESRTNIDIAVGIIIAQNHCTQAEAVQLLRRAARHQQIKLRALAERIVQTLNAAPVAAHFVPAPGQSSA
ncbi:ANTAR domain-containing protein [Arthrobacter sp. AET 35A]|uniref:ANTAR domain-containing protein n=1 Tax=Arthrobacter sp. AET 35A TaxID=2292643 RepID=UPI00177CFD5A|nr:ANTAR domain-containing protein [Arthrobacter sp. AET 35A]MBE0011255.1 ANTAR domain-containing protein [Arthrobacter sp. AET 35A]